MHGGGLYARVHYTTDPTKRDPKWAEEGAQSMGVKWWLQQMEMKEDVYDGEPIFPDFFAKFHAPQIYRENPIPIVPGSQYFGGWDCGTTRQPAFALCQVTPLKQIQWMFEVLPKVPMAMATFAPIVRQELIERLPAQRGMIVHFGDPTGGTKSGAEGYSAFEIAKESGFHIQPAVQFPAVRQDAVIWALTDWLSQDGPEESWVPRVVYSELDCPVLVAGMKGAYCYKLDATSPTTGPGVRVKKEPLKNWFSHVNDGHQYVSVELKSMLFTGGMKARSFTGW